MLPPLPVIELVELEDLTPPAAPGGFLRLRRQRFRVRDPEGRLGDPFVYDRVERAALDAVVVAAHYRDATGTRHVYVRSALRPPVHLRPLASRPLPEKATLGALWELPAGLVEPDECSAEGLRRSAARELGEETGFVADAAELQGLGPATFPSAGVIGERHHFFHLEVRPAERGHPSEDGSVLERGALVVALPLPTLLAAVRAGDIEDGKTEIGLRRLAELP
ncbi:MAG: NUDIX hydrolase [Myxococcales bacterium]|nr:NUDIX hydrolase [Myxococcales bacterium]